MNKTFFFFFLFISSLICLIYGGTKDGKEKTAQSGRSVSIKTRQKSTTKRTKSVTKPTASTTKRTKSSKAKAESKQKSEKKGFKYFSAEKLNFAKNFSFLNYFFSTNLAALPSVSIVVNYKESLEGGEKRFEKRNVQMPEGAKQVSDVYEGVIPQKVSKGFQAEILLKQKVGKTKLIRWYDEIEKYNWEDATLTINEYSHSKSLKISFYI